MKRGQAALEFLMTYGWAILVVLAAIAALAYFGVFNLKNLAPEACQLTAGFECKTLVQTNQVQFRIHNGGGIDLTNFQITVAGCTNNATAATFNDNSDIALNVTGCSFVAAQKIRQDVTLTYTEQNGFTRTKTGQVTAEVQ